MLNVSSTHNYSSSTNITDSPINTFIKILISVVVIAFSNSVYAQIRPHTISSGNKSNNNSNVYTPHQNLDDSENQDSIVDNTPKGIVYNDDILPDSVLRSHVYSFGESVRAVKLRHLQNPSLLPTGLQNNNPLDAVEKYSFATLGALGQVHQPLYYNHLSLSHTNRTSFINDPLPYYRQDQHTLRHFQSLTPYTLLGYGNSLDKDYQIHVIHTQNIRPRWNFAMLYDLISREGLYTNSGLTDHYLDLTTNYYSEDARYQLQASITYNRIRHQENGGVTNDTTCWDYSRESGVPVNMYAAQNQWRDIEFHIHQSYNTVRQFDLIRENKITDTIPQDGDSIVRTNSRTIYDTTKASKPSTFNTGVFALDLTYARHRRIFSDNQALSWFYNYGSIDTIFYFDSTTHHHLAAEVYWTNDAYMQHHYNNPVVISGGLRPQYDEMRFASPSAKSSELNITPFASARIHAGRFLLTADAEETNGARRMGDYRLSGNLSIQLGDNELSVNALSEAQSPSMVFYHNEGAYNWIIDDYNKIKQQRLAFNYSYINSDTIASKFQVSNLKLQLASTLLSDNVWFDSQMRPTQGNATALLLQADLNAHLRLGWFNLRTHQMLQHSNDDNVVRVPLFASKNSFYADFNMFHGALRTQIGIDARYHTKFYCDGWNPVLGAFYRQDEVEIGNYLIADLWLTLQVKRATIYLRASHLNAAIEKLAGLQPSYFSMPHYPYENFTLYWGIIWRFFD